MGLDKLYITKERILSHLEKLENIESLKRDVNIELIFSAEACIMDNWSSNFFADLNSSERQLRLEEKDSIFSDWQIVEKFSSLSETLISLYQKPSHLDILVTKEVLCIKELPVHLLNSESALFDWCKSKIIEHFDKI